MLKRTIVSTPSDPATVLASQRAAAGTRSEPRLLDWSEMTVTVNAQQGFDPLRCNEIPGGTIVRGGHSRFRVAHGLSSTPQIIHLDRLETAVGYANTPNDSTDAIKRSYDLVPESFAFSGYNSVKYRDTTAYAMVLLTPNGADSKYSHFTVGFPTAVWTTLVRLGSVGEAQVELPEYCGRVVAVTAQMLSAGGAAPLRVNMGGTNVGSCGLLASSLGDGDLGGYLIPGNRVAHVGSAGADAASNAGQYAIIQFWLAPANDSDVIVKVSSFLYDAPTKRGNFKSPGPEVHPAP